MIQLVETSTAACYTNGICCILCESQPTPRSASIRLELGGHLSISLFSTPLLLLLLLQSPLAFSLSTHSPSPLSQHLRSIPDNLPSASACPPLHLPILLSFRPPPPPFPLLRPPERLSSMAGQDLLCRTCLFLHRADSQVHNLTPTPGWSPPLREQVCMALIILTVTVLFTNSLSLNVQRQLLFQFPLFNCQTISCSNSFWHQSVQGD